MELRDFRDEDSEWLKRMHHEQGYDYSLPSLSDPRLWIVRKVLADDNGKPVQAVLGRLTSEAYFLESPSDASPTVRFRRFLLMHNAAIEAGRAAGVDSVHIWLPKEIEGKFGKQLKRLGWKNYLWPSYALNL